jgi:cholesterol oxidase
MPEERFDAVVVGSGFGGSVVAQRLADAGLDVLVLERGKAYPPGSFPRRPREMRDNFWDPSEGLHGMFDVWSFRHIEALVSSGLGGGSLIYANVLIRKDPKWFVHDGGPEEGYEHWPVTREDLDPHYDNVEPMLGAQSYPLDRAPYADTSKTLAMREAAGRLGLRWCLPKLAVSFAGPGQEPGVPIPEPEGNLHGRPRYTCRLCGECDIGCNYGSKNTLDYNYLSAAKRLGAEIRTRCEVRSFAPEGNGHVVRYVEHDPAREGRRTNTGRLPERTVRADRLVLSAGTLGTTYLLLRNRAAFPGIGSPLGTRFCGNGDLLAGLVNAQRPGGSPRFIDASRGPVITSAMRMGDALDGDGSTGRGFYLEDGGYPGFVDWLLEATDAPGQLRRLATFATHRLWAYVTGSPKSNLSARIRSLFGSGRLSGSSLPMLGMGRDIPDGRMTLRRKYLDVDWSLGSSSAYFDRLRRTMSDVAEALGGELSDNPLWYLGRVITVHALGGCPMGRHDREGVVDAHGAVFNHPGLYVADGSVMPGPVGPNPSLTIAAMADRTADRIIADHRGRAG